MPVEALKPAAAISLLVAINNEPCDPDPNQCQLMSHHSAEQEGDQVAEFQQLCEVQSDKASVEITSQYEGTITRLLHSEGDIVQVRPIFSAWPCSIR